MANSGQWGQKASLGKASGGGEDPAFYGVDVSPCTTSFSNDYDFDSGNCYYGGSAAVTWGPGIDADAYLRISQCCDEVCYHDEEHCDAYCCDTDTVGAHNEALNGLEDALDAYYDCMRW